MLILGQSYTLDLQQLIKYCTTKRFQNCHLCSHFEPNTWAV